MVTDIISKKWRSLSTKKFDFLVFWIFKFWWKIALDQNLIQLQAFDGLGQSGIINLTFGRWLRLHVSILLRILFDTKNNQFVKKFRILFALIKNFQSFSILRMNFNFWLNKKVQNLIYRLFIWSSLSRSKFDFSPVDFRLQNWFVDLEFRFWFKILFLIRNSILKSVCRHEVRYGGLSRLIIRFSIIALSIFALDDEILILNFLIMKRIQNFVLVNWFGWAGFNSLF